MPVIRIFVKANSKHMNTDIMYHAFGVSKQECLGIRRKDNQIIVVIETPRQKDCCSCCGSHNVIRSGSHRRQFRSVPFGARPCVLDMNVHRLVCKDCGAIAQEEIDFAKGKRRHTQCFANMVIDLSRFATIKDIAWFLQVSWDVVRNIQMEFLQKEYGNPDLSKLRLISIDEFAVRKGHVYKTIVIDLVTGRIVYAADGKSSSALDGFWEKLGERKNHIEAVCTDLSSAYINAVTSNLPNAKLVADHFHVAKLMNEAVDDLRRQQYHIEKDVNKRKVIKGSRWYLLRTGRDIFDDKFNTRLDNVLALNEPLMKAYYLKESLYEIWNQLNRADAEKVLDMWVQEAYDAKIRQLTKMAATVKAHKPYILAWYDFTISNGKIEGVNNKIKTMKRQAYGFRCDEFLTLKLYSLHDKRIRI